MCSWRNTSKFLIQHIPVISLIRINFSLQAYPIKIPVFNPNLICTNFEIGSLTLCRCKALIIKSLEFGIIFRTSLSSIVLVFLTNIMTHCFAKGPTTNVSKNSSPISTNLSFKSLILSYVKKKEIYLSPFSGY